MSQFSGSGEAFHGIPLRCVCGKSVGIFTAKTENNFGRRFYRCKAYDKVAGEHLFKWVDEAVVDEIGVLYAEIEVVREEIGRLKAKLEIDAEMVKQLAEKNKSYEKFMYFCITCLIVVVFVNV